MKIIPTLLRLTLLSLLAIVRINAQPAVVDQATIIKSDAYVQTSALGAVIDPRGQGPSYGGPYDFNVSVQGTNISALTPAPVVTLAAGSTWPTDNPTHHNLGVLIYNAGDDEWAYGYPGGGGYGGQSLAGRDAAFAFGDYQMSVQGVPFTLHFPAATTYPVNTPSVTMTGGSWIAGRYVIDVTQPLTITTNTFTNFDHNADAAMELGVESIVDLFAFYSDNHAAPHFQTYTIPANTLTAGRDYRGSASFYVIMDRPVVGGLPGSLTAAAYGMETNFIISTISAPTPGAQATMYRVGHLNDMSDANFIYSEVRDVTKVGGVIYAVGNSIAYLHDGNLPFPNTSDTGFLWTSTNGLTALPNVVDTFTPNPPFVTASAITADGAYIAGRTRAGGGGNERHANRVTVSGLVNLDLGTLPIYTVNAAALSISSDGSVMYGFSKYGPTGKTQSVRLTASGPTVTAIPFLNVGDDQSGPAPRAISSDGTIMIGTSVNTAVVAGLGPDHVGNQAFRYLHGTGVSAIPFLGGGTWNGALGLSPDGHLALISGNSTAYSGGEVYLYNFTGATSTSLGAPTGLNTPSNIGGMNSDGSLVVLSWGNGPNLCYLHNTSGWHSLTTIMSSAGLNLTNWTIDNIFGMSADGTLIWGVGTHNGNSEGWIVEFNPGYLAAFGGAPRDFNGDGKSDIIWTNTTTGERAMWQMNGGVLAAGASLGTVPTAWTISGTGDFNGDGKADVVLSNTSTGDRAMWLMNGSTVVSNIYLGNVPTSWTISAVGDYDGNGKADIFWSNTATGDRAMWLMNGGTLVGGAYLGVVPVAWIVAGTGDFNGDGKADVVWTNTSTGERAVWLMNGGTLQTGGSLGVVPTAWTISGVGDFNGDGKADIVLSNTATGDRAMWLMNGTAIGSNLYVGNVPVAWTINSVGDYDGNGKADFFWGNTITGDRAMWMMNGGTLTGGAYLGVVPVEWVNPH